MGTIDTLVHNEVYYCASSLVHEIGGEKIDQWAHLFTDAEYENEIFEHWIVSEWLADRLEAHGEVIEKDFYGLTIWGRTTTGQAISMDPIISEIFAELSDSVSCQ